MSFIDILEKHRSLSITEHDKGYRFEKLIQGYLKTEPLYAEIFSDVWLWTDFPYKDQFGSVDLGIDLVCKEEYGGYWAVQCKFYAEGTRIEKSEVDSFLVNSSRTFVIDGKRFEFSQRLWISTTEAWSANADESTKNQKIPFTKITLSDLETANVDWDAINKGIFGDKARKDKKKLRPHQVEAVDSAHEYYKTKSRGKLIMACGTGKTFTALKIAEKESSKGGYVLVLVPSISLLRQTLKEWASDAENGINPICICSDNSVNSKISNNDDVVESVVDLGYPASTNVKSVISQLQMHGKQHNNKLNVVFSTYQSIDVISGVQKQLPIIFDMIICDEAHRTTGVTLAGKDESAFVKVHNNDFINAKKRLYMTATPRLFAESSKAKAEQNSAQLCSMDDVSLYGEEIYRLGFGKAVEKDLLSDYKVLILTLSDNDLTDSVYKYLIGKGTSEINVNDMAKLIGCINALSKRVKGDYGTISTTDPQPMKRAVAFCQRIRDSESITKCFNDLSSRYLADLPQIEQTKVIPVVSKHIDGSMGAVERDKLISWLKSDSSDECHILTNVRCLSEGVDVPSLDAVMFLSPKNSQIDVVQSVGRVMRKTEGKKYGYIIIPVVIPNNVSADEALNDNERYKVVWTLLNALRAHDDRFDAIIHQIKLNGNKPPKDSPIVVVGVGGDSGDDSIDGNGSYQIPLPTEFVQLQDALFAKLVLKVGEKSYLENWAAEVGEIALKQQARIKKLVENPDVKKIFAEFVQSLQDNINPSISDDEAITMLSQHMITRPIFEALFENYSFASDNAVSLSMQKMIDVLEANAFDKDTKEMEQFYSDAKAKIGRVQNTDGRQKIILELYNKFFQTAFPKMSEQLGIVYTPAEVVDFILHSVDDVLRKEFGRGLTDENVHILDPFTGTGTFISRLLSSDLIKPEDLERKYTSEIHANEIVLLAYYIASVNIENVYHGLIGESENYEAFPGICLTDTFQLSEDIVGQLTEKFFPENSERVELQKKSPITVIIGNPPYSTKQGSANDNAQNQKYPKLERRIADTYVKDTKASNKNAVYDSYIKAFRWSTDRLKNGGIIGFVSNCTWLEGNSMDGFRKNLEKDFNSIYVFNLRGNQRTSGEQSRREGGKIFGSGSRTPVSITLLVKNPIFQSDKAKIFYYDIGDYLTREKKLSIITEFESVKNIEWKILNPNENSEWISQRNPMFKTFIPIGDKKGEEEDKSFFVPLYSLGVATHRDSWCYNSSKSAMISNMKASIDYYNNQVDEFSEAQKKNSNLKAKDFITYDSKKFSWADGQIRDVNNLRKYSYNSNSEMIVFYRPFYKQNGYINKELNERTYQIPKLFPRNDTNNIIICVSGIGTKKGFSLLITNVIPDLNIIDSGTQCFPLYYYEASKQDNAVRIQATTQTSLFAVADDETPYYTRKDGVSDFILNRARKQYKTDRVSKEDIFYYVYGLLHSREYRETFAADFKLMLPRLPLLEKYEHFKAFSKAGRELANLHLNYETVELYKDVAIEGEESGNFKVTDREMRFEDKITKDTIIFNNSIKISNIPQKAYEYVVNGKSALEWLMERYTITVNKDSGIKNDPNDWAEEVGNPRYILDLFLRVITVSVKTMEIVEGLPKLKFV